MKNFLKKVWLYPVLVIWFIASVTFFEYYLNRGNTDLTKELSPASFPVVCMLRGDYEFNRSFGYSQPMDFSLIRNGVTVLEEGRNLNFRIYKKNNEIEKINYELRSIDKERYIEEGEITSVNDRGDYIDVNLKLKDLILEKTDYSLMLLVMTDDGKQIYYYVRIVENDSLPFYEMLEFPFYFSDTTFDKTRAEEELVKFLESNKSGDNTDFNNVGIHSSLDTITWANLIINRISEPVCTVEEIDSKSAVMSLEYLAEAGTVDSTKTYVIKEDYRFIKGNDRIHLMDYHRSMNAVFFPDDEVVFNDTLVLGIKSPDFESMESDDGNTYAFVNEGALFIVNSAADTFGTAYSFYDSKHVDERTLNKDHDIKILNIDETGNVQFLVYGYFAGGDYEGRVGINVFEYNAKLNIIEEKAFIGCDTPYSDMGYDIDKLSYLNGVGQLFIYLDNTIYLVNLNDSNVRVLAQDLSNERLFVSETGNMIAFENKSGKTSSDAITFYNLDYFSNFDIKGKSTDRIRALGFMGEDLIYGKANVDDITTDVFGNVSFPMYEIDIVSKSGSVLKSYSHDNVFVMNCKLNDNLITLTRVEKDGEGNLVQAAPDSIVNTQDKPVKKNNVEVVSTENLKKIVQVTMKNEMDSKKIKLMTPKVALYEGHKEIVLEKISHSPQYYVFKGPELLGKYVDLTTAVRIAEENFGCVLDGAGHYIWKKEAYVATNQIMRISGTKADDETCSLETCIEVILDYNGYAFNVKNDLAGNKTPEEIFTNVIEGCSVVELENATVDELKYYLNRDIPILVLAGENSVLLIGYSDSVNVWMNPQTGNLMKVSIDEAMKMYEKYGQRFMAIEVWNS